MRDSQKEKPITLEEMKEKMLKMWETRERQDAELRKKYGLPALAARPREVQEKLLTRQELEEKILKIIEVREKQDDELRRKYQPFLSNSLPGEQGPDSAGDQPNHTFGNAVYDRCRIS
jgi:hypothetical protein